VAPGLKSGDTTVPLPLASASARPKESAPPSAHGVGADELFLAVVIWNRHAVVRGIGIGSTGALHTM